jgi:hypothetical protein
MVRARMRGGRARRTGPNICGQPGPGIRLSWGRGLGPELNPSLHRTGRPAGRISAARTPMQRGAAGRHTRPAAGRRRRCRRRHTCRARVSHTPRLPQGPPPPPPRHHRGAVRNGGWGGGGAQPGRRSDPASPCPPANRRSEPSPCSRGILSCSTSRRPAQSCCRCVGDATLGRDGAPAVRRKNAASARARDCEHGIVGKKRERHASMVPTWWV